MFVYYYTVYSVLYVYLWCVLLYCVLFYLYLLCSRKAKFLSDSQTINILYFCIL